GTALGSVQSFTTPAAPTVTTTAATLIASTSATLNGSANPNLATSSGWFRYDSNNPGSCNDSFGTRTSSTVLGAGSSVVTYGVSATGLLPGTTYFYFAIASNSVGTSFGSVLSFTTPAAPSVTTATASAIGSSVATLNGLANPNLAATTGW